MTSTTSSVAGAVPADRAPLDDVTVFLLPRPHDAGRGDLDADIEAAVAVLDAVQQQTVRVRRVLIPGFDQEREGADRVLRHPLSAERRVPLLLRRPLGPAVARWEVVEDARRSLPVEQGHWLWFLAPDSRPAPDALAALLAATRRSSRVGVVGPKLVAADDPRRLVGLGHHLTVAGRSTDADPPGLVDQGQHDLRQDVLGVPLVGSLVDSAVLDAVGGLDRAFGEDGVDGLDLGWRSHLAGQRVVVAPEAVVQQGQKGLGVRDPRRTRMRQRQVALARGSAWAAPWRALGVAFTSLLAALVLLLVKRPEEAAGEWTDVRAVLSPARGWGARRRFAPRRTVRPRDLTGLHSPATSGWRSTRETVVEALDPRAGRWSDRSAGRVGAPHGGTETGPVSEEFATLAGEGRRSRFSGPLTLAVLITVVVTAWWGRGLSGALDPGGLGLVGPELGPAATDAHGLFSSALDGWRGGGLGHERPAETWLLPAAAVAWVVSWLPGAGSAVAGPALAWVLALAGPLSVVSAYLALRRATHGRWVRALLALGWAGLAPLTLALGDGRLGPAVVHVLAPLLVAGAAVCAVPAGGPRRTAACFATVLGIALAALWVPALLVLSTVGGLLLLVLGRRSARWRGGVLAVLPWALLVPWLPAALSEPVRLAGGAGATQAVTSLPSAGPVWQTVLLQPGVAVDLGSLAAVPLWLTGPLWLAALGALLVPGRPGRRAGVLMAVALLALAGALLALRTGLGRLPAEHAQAGLVVTAWPGTALSIAGAALLLATGILVDRLLHAPSVVRRKDGEEDGATDGTAEAEGPRRGWRRALVALVLAPTALLGAWGLVPDLKPDALAVAEDPLPAVAGEQGRGPAALRTLVLDPTGPEPTDAVRVDLLGSEPEPARILRDRTTDLVTPAQEQDEVLGAAEALVSGASPEEAGEAMTDVGAGYLLLQASADHPLAAQIDRVNGLTRVSGPPDQVLWRRTDADAGRVRVLDADGAPIGRLGVTGPHARAEGDLRALPGAAALDVAEGGGWSGHARVLVDGQEASVSPENQVAVPEGARLVEVGLDRPRWTWHAVTLGLALIVGFLALPVGRRESRTGPGRELARTRSRHEGAGPAGGADGPGDATQDPGDGTEKT
ncbi:glycosyltransferase [Ornithinimicrobium sufpigmenti]|uniref:glycosyltransferase n=1 Tax=Ornithinimicrobium sufpigmenti TaxID=2508882 RepID=UPI001035C816|nr:MULTISPECIES: glycosyltransferase [unclassified Ornithinimicrobium]